MRKVIVLLVIAVAGILINFGFWFFQTQTIREALNNVKTRAAESGVELEFKDVKFTSFKSWDVKAVVEGVRITSYIPGESKDRQFMSRVEMHKIWVKSNPLKKALKLKFPSIINIEQNEFNRVGKYAFVSTKQDSNAFVVFTLNESLGNFEKHILGIKLKSFFDFVKEVKLVQGEAEFIDVSRDNQKKMIIKGASLDVTSDSSDSDRKLQVNSIIDGVEYNKEYKAGDRKLQLLFDNDVKLGVSSYMLDAKVEHKKQDGELTKEYVTINKLEGKNELFSIMLAGNIDKEDKNSLPNFNVDLTLTNYSDLVAYYANIFNSFIVDDVNALSMVRAKPFSDSQIKAFAGFLKRFSVKGVPDNQAKLKLVKTGSDITVTGKPIILVIKQLQRILSSKAEDDVIPQVQ